MLIELFSIKAPEYFVLPSIPSVAAEEIITLCSEFSICLKMRRTNSWLRPPFPFPLTSTVGSPPKIMQDFPLFGITFTSLVAEVSTLCYIGGQIMVFRPSVRDLAAIASKQS